MCAGMAKESKRVRIRAPVSRRASPSPCVAKGSVARGPVLHRWPVCVQVDFAETVFESLGFAACAKRPPSWLALQSVAKEPGCPVGAPQGLGLVRLTPCLLACVRVFTAVRRACVCAVRCVCACV